MGAAKCINMYCGNYPDYVFAEKPTIENPDILATTLGDECPF